MRRMSFNKIGRRSQNSRGFRLNIRRFSVQRLLRAKLFLVFRRLFSRWRFSYGDCLRCLKQSVAAKRKGCATYGYRQVVDDYRMKSSLSFERSDSFYSEAIADCLDFIKRNSISLDERQAAIIQR